MGLLDGVDPGLFDDCWPRDFRPDIMEGILEMKKALSQSAVGTEQGEDLYSYLNCPLRRGEPRISTKVCHKQRCIFLGSEDGKPKCNYGDPNAPK